MNKNRADLIRECDRLWSRLVAHGTNYRCILCGKPGDDSHHWRYIRSIHQYRWSLENGVYMDRVCHNEVEQSMGKKRELYLTISKNYPHLWAWAEEQPPLRSWPISTWNIEVILRDLQRTAKQLGVKYE